MSKFTFSGHETFHCRHFWLKKGYDFLSSGHHFNADDAVVQLGVGKNMVSAIRFWMRAFGLVDDNDQPNKFADFIFSDKNGVDPFLEDTATLWLLHHQLIKNQKASIYDLIFNDLRRERLEFSRETLLYFLKRKCDETDMPFNENTVGNDINVFIKNYLRPKKTSKHIEDDFSGLLIELDLIDVIHKDDLSGSDWFKIESKRRDDIPEDIFLYAILDRFNDEKSISFQKLVNANSGVGMIFAVSTEGLINKINKLTKKYDFVVFSDNAGIRELQIKNDTDRIQILKNYYAN